MIKARGTTADGRPLVILGLSGENVTRLMADEPIVFSLGDMGLSPYTVVIVGGRTETDIATQLETHGLLPPGTADKVPDVKPGQPLRVKRPEE